MLLSDALLQNDVAMVIERFTTLDYDVHYVTCVELFWVLVSEVWRSGKKCGVHTSKKYRDVDDLIYRTLSYSYQTSHDILKDWEPYYDEWAF